AYVELGATAADTCAGNLTGAIVIDASGVNVNAVGRYTGSYTARDAFDRTSVLPVVNVIDTTPPVLKLSGADPQVIECHSAYVERSEERRVGKEGKLTGAMVIDASGVNVNAVGSYTVSYTVSDGFNRITIRRAVNCVE